MAPLVSLRLGAWSPSSALEQLNQALHQAKSLRQIVADWARLQSLEPIYSAGETRRPDARPRAISHPEIPLPLSY